MKQGQKLEHNFFFLLFFTLLYWSPVVHVCFDHRPWLNSECVYVCVCACLCVKPRLASLHKQRRPETGKVTFFSNNWRDPTSDCTVCTCPICSLASVWAGGSRPKHQGVPMAALSNTLSDPPPSPPPLSPPLHGLSEETLRGYTNSTEVCLLVCFTTWTVNGKEHRSPVLIF